MVVIWASIFMLYVKLSEEVVDFIICVIVYLKNIFQVLEDIFLTPRSSLHLSGKAFELLTDVFLFYDFSVTGLLQSIKVFSTNNSYYLYNIYTE